MNFAQRRHLHATGFGLISPASGNAVVTVARGLGVAQNAAGGSALFLAPRALPNDPTPMEMIEVDTPSKVWPTAREKVVDRFAGATIGRWPTVEGIWTTMYEAVPQDEAPVVFVHNEATALAGLRRARPNALGVAYLHNDLFRGWPTHTRKALAMRGPVVAVSRFIADRMLPGAADRGRVLPLVNGVDTKTFHPSAAEVEPRVLFVGKVTPHKGPDLLIEAALLLAERGVRFRLDIVGASVLWATQGMTPFERFLRYRAEPLGDWIRFLPFVTRDRIGDTYRDATICVVPSNWDDPCPLAVGEGLASGLACVASNRGGIPEIGGEAAMYFDPSDVASLALCLERLLLDDDERRARADAARKRALELTWDSRLRVLNEWLADWTPKSRSLIGVG